MPPETLPRMLEALESLARTGWMLRGVPPALAETVAVHSFKAAVIAYETAVKLKARGLAVSPEKAALIALFHDVAESVIGDIAKTAGIGEAKREAEARAVEALPLSAEARELVREYEEDSPEALVARAAELAATALEAERLERTGYPGVSEIRNSSLAGIVRAASRVPWGSALLEDLAGITGLPLSSRPSQPLGE